MRLKAFSNSIPLSLCLKEFSSSMVPYMCLKVFSSFLTPYMCLKVFSNSIPLFMCLKVFSSSMAPYVCLSVFKKSLAGVLVCMDVRHKVEWRGNQYSGGVHDSLATRAQQGCGLGGRGNPESDCVGVDIYARADVWAWVFLVRVKWAPSSEGTP